MAHLHVSALDFLVTACYVLIFAFLWRQLAARLSERPIGKAMGAIF